MLSRGGAVVFYLKPNSVMGHSHRLGLLASYGSVPVGPVFLNTVPIVFELSESQFFAAVPRGIRVKK